jgi:energy-coupling factor transporter ATP-binding protein EcfA2
MASEPEAKAPAPKRVRKPRPPRLQVSHLGPIQLADVSFKDLTVIVGPQATGKSIFLQTLKLLVDREQIHDTFKHHGMSFNDKTDAFLEGYFGRGLSSAWGAQSSMVWNGASVRLPDYAKPSKSKTRHERMFYIPAQRVMSLPGGVSQNFGQFNYGDPYTLRAFSDAVHDLIQNEFGAKGELFPGPNRLNQTLRTPIQRDLYGGNRLEIDANDFTKRVGLHVKGHSKPLGFLSWSAGQREFTPMLMGVYWLCSTTNRRKTGKTAEECIEWVVIEEPEMGLHPQGIAAVLLLVLELMRRGYKVVLSTHSPVVLDMVWALQEFKKLGSTESSVRQIFDLPSTPDAKRIAQSALTKDYGVYCFDRDGSARDISNLDPGAVETAESEWGGISGFATKTNNAIADAVAAAEAKPKRARKPSTQGVA